MACCVTRENVGPHNDTRFKHLRLASGRGASGAEVPQSGSKGGMDGPSGSKRGPLGNLLRSFRASVTVIRVGPCTARGSCGPSGVRSFIIRALNAREENSAQDSGSVYTSEGPSGSFGVPQSRGVESLIRGGLSNGPGSPDQPVRA